MSIKIGCQTITFGNDRHASEIEDIFKAVSEAGYHGLEVGLKRLDTQKLTEYKDMLNKYSLKLVAIHVPSNFRDDESTEHTYKEVMQAAQTAKELGSKNVFMSGDRGRDIPGYYVRAAGHMSELAKKAKDIGITLSFHNHGHVIADNARGLFDLADNSDPQYLHFALDVGWIYNGGQCPVDIVGRLLDRLAGIHFKEFTAAGEEGIITELGMGKVDFKGVYDLIKNKKDFWIVSEQDKSEIGPEESIRRNFKAIMSIMK